MNILYIGDIMGEPGIETIQKILPRFRVNSESTLILAQAENVTDGKGMSLTDMKRLQDIGVDFFTGGNHTPTLPELHDCLDDETSPVIGPANLSGCPGNGWKYLHTQNGKILIISLMGQTVGKSIEITNPLAMVDKILDENRTTDRIATIVNFHGDYSSEKRVIGYYLDGRVTAVIGDHWHVPTADAIVLPKGTAHITDVGMCGSLHSSLGVKTQVIIDRWRNGHVNKNELETAKPYQFNAVQIEVNESTGLAKNIEHIQESVV